MAVQRYLRLGDRQRLAPSDTNLPGDQIEAGDGFGDRMLDLQAGVHLHEEELAACIQQKLDRARADVADSLCRLDRGLAHGPTQLDGQARGGRFLDHFLVAALDGAVALVEVQAVAVLVGKYLDLHVPRLEQVFLHEHARVAERGLRFALGRLQCFDQVGFSLDDLHAFAAATGSGLE